MVVGFSESSVIVSTRLTYFTSVCYCFVLVFLNVLGKVGNVVVVAVAKSFTGLTLTFVSCPLMEPSECY